MAAIQGIRSRDLLLALAENDRIAGQLSQAAFQKLGLNHRGPTTTEEIRLLTGLVRKTDIPAAVRNNALDLLDGCWRSLPGLPDASEILYLLQKRADDVSSERYEIICEIDDPKYAQIVAEDLLKSNRWQDMGACTHFADAITHLMKLAPGSETKAALEKRLSEVKGHVYRDAFTDDGSIHEY